MATKWISPTWRMPEESNQSKFENYSLNFNGSDNRIQIPYTELNGSTCLLYTSPSPRDRQKARMPSSA